MSEVRIIELLERLVELNEQAVSHMVERDRRLMDRLVRLDAYEESQRQVRESIDANSIRLQQLAIKDRELEQSFAARVDEIGRRLGGDSEKPL